MLLYVFSWRRSQNRFSLSVIVLDRDCNDDSKPGDGGPVPAEFRAGWPQGIAPLGLPQIRTCTFAHTARHIMNTLRDGSLSESAIRLVPDSTTVVGSCTRLRVSMHPPCVPPTVS